MSILDELKALEAGLSEKRDQYQGYKPPGKRTAGPKLNYGKGLSLPPRKRGQKKDPRL